MKATAKELRFHSKELLDAVNRGEEVIITYRGMPCARLIPFDNKKTIVKYKNELFGVWKDRDDIRDVEHYVRNLRKGRV